MAKNDEKWLNNGEAMVKNDEAMMKNDEQWWNNAEQWRYECIMLHCMDINEHMNGIFYIVL